MIGILIITHGELGSEIVKTAHTIGLKSEERLGAIPVDPTSAPELLRESVRSAIDGIDDGDGVLILTDLFGGTPTNVSLSFLEDGKVEVVTGVNLPMVVRAINSRGEHDLQSLSKVVSQAGKESIYLAGEVLRQRLPGRGGDDN
jgi:PTS system mannose-specific IIA component